MNNNHVRPFRDSIPSLIFFLLLCAGAAAFGGMFGQGEWYQSLTKPALNPPGWVFGPVWTVLYILMALAAWLVWRTGGKEQPKKIAIGLFILQLIANALWSWFFFGLHHLTLALVDILVINALILATIFAFARVNKTASLMMVPYWLWVSFATYLTWAIRALNT
ncbi:MAG: tryptophan-rich sensory protein [Ignavibacteriae bacterium]|nr:tryptophan-rich sensory protein [Ignavibacteriota bacterium]MCB9215118.1 tryptophan-rich sensory protein [Ignavibacteria bacterium]